MHVRQRGAIEDFGCGCLILVLLCIFFPIAIPILVLIFVIYMICVALNLMFGGSSSSGGSLTQSSSAPNGSGQPQIIVIQSQPGSPPARQTASPHQPPTSSSATNARPYNPYQPPTPPAPTQAFSPTPRLTGFSLIVIDGPLTGRTFEIYGTCEVGRGATAVDLTGDDKVSRYHALLVAETHCVRVTDSGSTNGTFVNDQRVSAGEAHVGDIIRVGNTSLKVEAL